jgi:predicted nucleic acid-binding protein
VILLDTSGLLAAVDSSQRQHRACAETLLQATPPLLLSPFVLAELDYLVATRVGQAAEVALLKEVAAGTYRLEAFSSSDMKEAADILSTYVDLELGLADASLVILSRRHDVDDLLTLDERHFRTIQPAPGRSFRLLPADRT